MSMQDGTRTRFATILILLLVLVTGSVVGIAADRRLGAGSSEGTEEASAQQDASSGAAGQEAVNDTTPRRRTLIVERVGLSEVQFALVDSIVSDYRRRQRELHDEIEDEIQQAYRPRYRVMLQEVREEIKGVLTPEQRMAYDSLLVDYDRRREEERRADSIAASRG